MPLKLIFLKGGGWLMLGYTNNLHLSWMCVAKNR